MASAEQRQAERGSIVGVAAVDYLTMTTRNGAQYELVRQWMDRHRGDKETKAAKSFMFTLDTVEWGSYGEGMHEQEPIYIINVNGIDSDNLVGDLCANPAFIPTMWNCARCDIQLTVPAVRKYRLLEIGIMHHSQKWKFADPKATAKVRYWGSENGDSLYVGAPTSLLQIRIYDKFIVLNGDTKQYERFEGQLRDDYAQSMFLAIFKNRALYNRSVILNSIRYYHNRLPVEMQSELSQAAHLDKAVSVKPEPVTTDKQERAKVKWALRLKGSLLELAREPGPDGERVREMLLECLVRANTSDPYEAWHEWRLLSPDGEAVEPI